MFFVGAAEFVCFDVLVLWRRRRTGAGHEPVDRRNRGRNGRFETLSKIWPSDVVGWACVCVRVCLAEKISSLVVDVWHNGWRAVGTMHHVVFL